MKNVTITQEGLNKTQKSRNRVLELMGFEPDTNTITIDEPLVMEMESNEVETVEIEEGAFLILGQDQPKPFGFYVGEYK